jgi:uncharacterized protein DUF6461
VVGVDDYRWAQWNPRLDAYCVTAVAGGSRQDVLSAFEAERGSETLATFEEAFNDFPETSYVLVDEVPGGALAVENNGWQGVQEEVVTALSRGATVAAFYRNVNAVMTFVHAMGGRVLTSFDPLLDEVPSELAHDTDGLPFGAEHAEPSSLALLERLTGIRLDEDWLASPHSRFDVPSPV